MLPSYNQGLAPFPTQVKDSSQPIEVPVAAFPLRGRCNPYCIYLFPLLLLRLLIFLSLLGALITSIIIPKDLDSYNNQTPQQYISTRVGAIVIYAVAIGFTLTTFLVEMLNCCNIADSKYIPIFISFLDLFFGLASLGISIPMIVREAQISGTASSLYNQAIDQNAFLAAGIQGLSAVFFYMLHLFMSRFYQFCIGNYKNMKREFLSGSLPYGPNAAYNSQPNPLSIMGPGGRFY